MNNRDPDAADASELIGLGSEVAGSVAGAAVGLFSAGPAGAVAGAALGPMIAHTFKKIGGEVRRRLLSHQEEVRAGAALAFAVQKVRENVDSGQQVRDDGFFQAAANDRSAADEIVEGALVAAQREHEEKKVQFIGYLVGNLPFSPEIDRATANYLLSLSERLSYRQLTLLRLFADPSAYDLRSSDYRSAQNLTPNQLSAVQEAYDLYALGLVNGGGTAYLGPADLEPANMRVQGAGVHLHNKMELWRLDPRDVAAAAAQLR